MQIWPFWGSNPKRPIFKIRKSKKTNPPPPMDTLLGMHLFLSREGGSRPQTYHILGGKNNLEHHKSPPPHFLVGRNQCFPLFPVLVFTRGSLILETRGLLIDFGRKLGNSAEGVVFFLPVSGFRFSRGGGNVL